MTLCDFEEDVGANLTPLQCQVRDALIYGHSLFRVFHRTDPEMALQGLNAYWQAAPPSVKNATTDKVQSMDALLSVDVFLGRYLGGDALAIFSSMRHFYTLSPSVVV